MSYSTSAYHLFETMHTISTHQIKHIPSDCKGTRARQLFSAGGDHHTLPEEVLSRVLECVLRIVFKVIDDSNNQDKVSHGC